MVSQECRRLATNATALVAGSVKHRLILTVPHSQEVDYLAWYLPASPAQTESTPAVAFLITIPCGLRADTGSYSATRPFGRRQESASEAFQVRGYVLCSQDTHDLEEAPMRMLCLTVLCGAMFIAMPSAARAQAPILGQPYQVPFEFSGYGAGTPINYGGYNYVIQGDGTMLPSQDSGFTYSSQYGPPATTYYVQQPAVGNNPWVGYRPGWHHGGYHQGWNHGHGSWGQGWRRHGR